MALSGAAVAIASSGSGRDHPEDSTTNTTGTTTTQSVDRRRSLDGRVVAIDATAKSFDLQVRRHHKRSTVTITVTDATVYKKLADGFDSIKVSYRIKAKVRRIDGAWVASKVERKRAHHHADDNNRDDDGTADRGRSRNDDGPNHDAGDDHGGGSNSGPGGGGRDD
jgi:hypothetical protein